MTTRNVLAESKFDHTVQLIEVQEQGFAGVTGVNVHCYYVTYGMQTRDCGQNIASAWKEFKDCTEHAMTCAGLMDDE